MKTTQIINLKSPKSGNYVPNQFRIKTPKGEFYQSYNSKIIFICYDTGNIYLDQKFWNYSNTTSRYRNQFLKLTTSETKNLIASGVIQLIDLN